MTKITDVAKPDPASEAMRPSLPLPKEEILADYRLAVRSRHASVIGRREVLNGKAKFGVFGDGKELPQLAMARATRKGDWRSGYYRDQTWLLALGVLDLNQHFAQLFADTDLDREPHMGGRSMNGHFSTRYLNGDGSWRDQMAVFNSAADVSPTASQMPRAVGLAYASVLYRKLGRNAGGGLDERGFSHGGDEVTWVTIGNASAAEGLFWESVNAIGVLNAPAVVVVYDDGYGISVPNSFQMVKENISAALEGFRRVACPDDHCDRGFDLYTVPCWDYPELLSTFAKAGETARVEHIPALVHVVDCTQPLGHSTSGSHERYKTAERLDWERDYDCVAKFRAWILASGEATAAQLDAIDEEERLIVETARKEAYEAVHEPMREERSTVVALLRSAAEEAASGLGAADADRIDLEAISAQADRRDPSKELRELADGLASVEEPERRAVAVALHRGLLLARGSAREAGEKLAEALLRMRKENDERYGSQLYSTAADSALLIPENPPVYSDGSPTLMGFEVINAAFDAAFARDSRVIAFGEDLGYLGDVNQGFRGLQEKYGPYRVSDTGIREATIVGQAIGMAMRGLRPIAEIQYLDYLLYGLQILSDDLATLRWRTVGGQKAPVIIRTRGHRLEGIWHSGSSMAGILNLVRGMYLLVPRDFTRAAGFYNTLLRSGESAIVVEVLSGYRRKEKLPENIGELTVPLGVCEVLRPGTDLTIVTYGAMTRIVLEAAERLAEVGAEIEVIDVQSLLPFDIEGAIAESIRKTSRVLFADEDVPGGATAYMMREVLERQNAYELLDSPPRCISSTEHRPAYGSDGDYWSKPNAETVFDAAYELLREAMPARYPALY
jgi:pyruvate/2-oxoglutarate/acetoin dehydrogenase E1 component/TPP-dependent pyruvate/acetoin dehydrogenase alpha subunit